MVFAISSTEKHLSNALAHVTPKYITLYFQSPQKLHTPESWLTRDKKAACWILICRKFTNDNCNNCIVETNEETVFLPPLFNHSLQTKLRKIRSKGFQHSGDIDENQIFHFQLVDLRFLRHPVTTDYKDLDPTVVEMASQMGMKYPSLVAMHKNMQ